MGKETTGAVEAAASRDVCAAAFGVAGAVDAARLGVGTGCEAFGNGNEDVGAIDAGVATARHGVCGERARCDAEGCTDAVARRGVCDVAGCEAADGCGDAAARGGSGDAAAGRGDGVADCGKGTARYDIGDGAGAGGCTRSTASRCEATVTGAVGCADAVAGERRGVCDDEGVGCDAAGCAEAADSRGVCDAAAGRGVADADTAVEVCRDIAGGPSAGAACATCRDGLVEASREPKASASAALSTTADVE